MKFTQDCEIHPGLWNSAGIVLQILPDTMSTSMFTTMSATMSTSMCIPPIRIDEILHQLNPEDYSVCKRIFITISATLLTSMSNIMSATSSVLQGLPEYEKFSPTGSWRLYYFVRRRIFMTMSATLSTSMSIIMSATWSTFLCIIPISFARFWFCLEGFESITVNMQNS